MPYFIYKIFTMPIQRLEKLEQHESFREASNRAKQLRAELAGDAQYIIKVIFAETELHADDLLSQVRAATPGPGDD
ncbi:MAG: hypothetical protein NUV63_12880 [Gallionella sp.]|nr:hypothetical protein [Gallionella sp.]